MVTYTKVVRESLREKGSYFEEVIRLRRTTVDDSRSGPDVFCPQGPLSEELCLNHDCQISALLLDTVEEFLMDKVLMLTHMS